ncbi:MAG: hypothetical protein PHW25_05310 [Zoogloea sp.]|uniref:hypothetical protein n=1 Tax=Zoogloea sp. TaxID=49181 RepID=UPI00262E1ED2|nr:hypothetical protein [Zoogloea sp.]MDD3326488.1 hypothetical protein [Zoogloea sp.]
MKQIQRLGLMQRFSQRDEGEFEGMNPVIETIEFFSRVFFHEGFSCGWGGYVDEQEAR